MLQSPWYKVFVWFLTTSFFFLASATLIAVFSPPPGEQQVMQFMMGMMRAMDNSLMGLAMMAGEDSFVLAFIELSTLITAPLILISLLGGLLVRGWRK